MSETITIVIPTYKRPDRLVGCLDSALAQDVPGYSIRILVVDNDAACSAKAVATGRADYICESAPGVSNARNTAVAAVTSRYIFFLDDDMTAEPGCIARMLDVMQTHGAGVAYAAVEAVMPADSPQMEAMQPFFSRRPNSPEGPIENCLGAGGSLFDLSRCPLPDPVFNPSCNETGGEDDLLLSHLARKGVEFVWVPSAMTREIVPAHRATLAYLWTRNFAFGQGPTQMAADHVRANGGLMPRLQVAKWMGVGIAQFALRLPAWTLSHLTGSARHATNHARLAQAAGKVLWWDSFRQVLYGASVTPPTLKTSRT